MVGGFREGPRLDKKSTNNKAFSKLDISGSVHPFMLNFGHEVPVYVVNYQTKFNKVWTLGRCTFTKWLLGARLIPKIKFAWLCLYFVLSKTYTKGNCVPIQVNYKQSIPKVMPDTRRS